ncbi:MAG: hypothetical protein HKO81_02120 [Flavobacteriaceae bacterium]|nr:hypothetical protein [Flavobacteriaceae bacterium]
MKTLLLLLSIIFMTFTVQSQPKVITVDNRANSGADYTDLSVAVTSATVGDTIQIHPSATAYGNISVNKTLHLVGLGHNPAISKFGEVANVGNITLSGDCDNTTISGLSVNQIKTSNPVIDITDILIKNNKINSYVICANNTAIQDWIVEGNIFVTSYVQPYGEGWIIKNNIFDNTSYALHNADNTDSFLNNLVILANGNFAYICANPIVNNNIFILEGTTQSVNLYNSAIDFNYCLTENPVGYPVTALPGSNNLDDTNPGFSFDWANIDDYYNNDYNVSGSAANAGSDGTDLGVFGANFNFDVDGRPDDYPYMTSLVISNSSVPLGQNINVTFTAGKKQ